MAQEYRRPSTSAGGTWANPTQAYDGTDAGDNGTYAGETGGDSDITWSGFSSGGTYTALTFHVVYEIVGTTASDTFLLEYSLDGGSSWETPIYNGQFTEQAKTDFNIALSTSQDLTLIQVRGFFDKVGGGDNGIEARVWEIYTDGTLDPTKWGGADLTPSATLSVHAYSPASPNIYINLDIADTHPAPPAGITYNSFYNSQDLSIHSLVDAENVAVSETLQVIDLPDNESQELDTTGDNSGFLHDITMYGFWYDNPTPADWSLEFANLDSDYVYTIKVWAVETVGTSPEDTEYTVGLETYSMQTNTATSDNDWDKTVGVTFTDLEPDGSNKILLGIDKGVRGTHGAIIGGIQLIKTLGEAGVVNGTANLTATTTLTATASSPIDPTDIYISYNNSGTLPDPPTGITFNHFTGNDVAWDIVTVHPLVDKDNTATPETMRVNVAPAGTWYDNATTGDNSGFLPDTTMDEYWYKTTDPHYEIEFASLDPDYLYTIKVWGSTVTALDEAEDTEFTVGATTYSMQTNGDYTGWDKTVGVTFTDLVPDGNNKILLEIDKGARGTKGTHLSGLQIIKSLAPTSGTTHWGVFNKSSSATLTASASKETLGVFSKSASATIASVGSLLLASSIAVTAPTTLSVDALIDVNGGSTLNASASLSAVPKDDRYAIVSLDASTSLVVDGTKYGELFGATDWSASASLSIDGQLELLSATSLTADTTLTADGNPYGVKFGATTLASSATVGVVPKKITLGVSALSSSASLTADGETETEHWAVFSKSSSASVSAVATIQGTESGSALLYSGASLSVIPRLDLKTASSLSAGASQVASGDVHGEKWGSAPLSASCALDVSGEVYGEKFGSTSLGGSATLSSGRFAELLSSADLTADATLSASGDIGGVTLGSASLSAYTTTEILCGVEKTSTISMVGSATISAVPSKEVPLSASLSADSDLQCVGSNHTLGTVSVLGSTSLVADSFVVHNVSISFQSTASLTANSEAERFGNVSVSAPSSLSAVAFLDGKNQANLYSQTIFSASAYVESYSEALLISQTTILVTAESYGELFGVSDIQAVSQLSIVPSVARMGFTSLLGSASITADGTVEAPVHISIVASAVLSAYGSTGAIPECNFLTDYDIQITDRPETRIVSFDTTVVTDFDDIIITTDEEIQITDCG